jgi:hypothetical protein
MEKKQRSIKPKKENRGGYRENAGRPKLPETKTISNRVPAIHYENLKDIIAKVIADFLK